jgi:hypothetical protein
MQSNQPIKFFFPDDAPAASFTPADIAALAVKDGRIGSSDGSFEGSVHQVTSDKTDSSAAAPETPSGSPAAAASNEPVPPNAEPATGIPAASTPPAAAPAPVTPPPVVERPLAEVLNSHAPGSIFKELGFDESTAEFLSGRKSLDPKMIQLIKTWEEQGNLQDYLFALNTDFKKMSSEDVMRHQLRETYPHIQGDAFEVLYQAKVLDQYQLDAETHGEEAAKRGRILLDADAHAPRQALIASQQTKLLPHDPAKPEQEPNKE